MFLCRKIIEPYLIDGGAPAGIKMLPGDDGCRTISTRISIITIQGNKSTAPRGMDILEFPFNRILLLKNANRGVSRFFRRERSSREGNFSREGRFGDEGMRFTRFCTNPMYAEG